VVTGTDPDVGKTFVTEALARRLARDRRVIAIKPFESGGGSGPTDAERLARATGQAAPKGALVRLRAPLAPAMAAEDEGVTLDLDAVLAQIRALAAEADLVIVEGAGGVLSPLTWTSDITTVAHALEARVLLVASDRLGTLSATHTAVDVLADHGLCPSAIALSAPAAPDASTGRNAAALRIRLAEHGACAGHIVEIPRTDAEGALRAIEPLARWLC
jgi:dethiobiotin synthetase